MNTRKTNLQKILEVLNAGNYGDQCIEYCGGKNSHGYGVVAFPIRVGLEGRMSVHRLALELVLNREINPGLAALHKCDNRICFNPNHLYEGTISRNAQDAHDRKRHPSRKGSKHPLAKLTEQDVTEMIRLGTAGLLQKTIGEMFGISQQTVSKILRGDRWNHVKRNIS